jgi:hypothetical protein
MVAFIDDHRDVYGVEPICAVLPIAPSTYYAAKARQRDLSPRARRDRIMRGHIRRIWQTDRCLLGRARYGTSCAARATKWPAAPLSG